jgi:hypothetical protein
VSWSIGNKGDNCVSQLWPDIPELVGIPEVLRSGIWMQAYTRAIGRWQTWALGLLCVVGCGGTAGAVAAWATGVLGAMIGAFAGIVFGAVIWVRYVIEWQARRMVPIVRAAAGWPIS